MKSTKIPKEVFDKNYCLTHFTIEKTGEAVFWVDSNARFCYVNDAACQSLGYTHKELLCLAVHDVTPEYPQNVWPKFWEEIKKKKTLMIETHHRSRDGRVFPVEIAINYVECDGKEYSCSFVRDLTNRRQIEEEIVSLAKFPSENPNPVLRVSKDGVVIYANEGGKPLLKVWGCEVNETLPDKWRDCVAEVFHSVCCKEMEIKCGGKVFLAMFSPVLDAGYVCVYGRDITKLKQTEEELRKALTEVNQLKSRLQAENIYLQQEIKLTHNFGEIISSSEAFKKVLGKVEQVASTDAAVLILGETGTGKELIARAVHNISSRRDRPLVKVNCAALPASLIESELFGYERGAFTGAQSQRIGRFELANGGTIFLDEIGDLPVESQAKLLRVLQEGEFERLGSQTTTKVDVRVIAATNRNLEKTVQAGNFREDLYYRLNVFPITCPPLRERKEDIPFLVNHFVRKYANKIGKNIMSIPSNAMDSFMTYHWPGNIRELENIIERAVIVSNSEILVVDQLTDHKEEHPGNTTKVSSLKELERAHILEVLESSHWVIDGKRGAAQKLELNPSTLRDRMRKYGIQRPSPKS